MTEIKPLTFVEDAAVIEITFQSELFNATAIDFQDDGVMFEYVDGAGVARRAFRPWVAVRSITQKI